MRSNHATVKRMHFPRRVTDTTCKGTATIGSRTTEQNEPEAPIRAGDAVVISGG